MPQLSTRNEPPGHFFLQRTDMAPVCLGTGPGETKPGFP